MSKPLIYAELLSNIRQISVIAALDTPCDTSTTVQLSADGQQITLHHLGASSTLKLPGEIVPNSPLQRPVLGSKELSWRLPLHAPHSRHNAEDAVGNEAPWPATDLKEDSEFLCRSCGAIVLRQGSITSWRDLPSENWAEMMDFWHCHKPDVPESEHEGHSHGDNASRGYGANTKFTAKPGIGFVDLTTFLVSESDCPGVKIGSFVNNDAKYPILVCTSCAGYLGHVDHQSEGYRLYKWRLESTTTSSPQPKVSALITSQLQSIMLAQCCSRLILVPMSWKPSSQDSTVARFLSMWILSPTIRYSTTTQMVPKRKSGTLAMKIFWKAVSATDADTLLNGTTHEEVSLPSETILEIEKLLQESASVLPPSGQRFQNWDVGLLEKFEKD